MSGGPFTISSPIESGAVISAERLSRSGGMPVRHAFFTRQGGVSDDIYASLNMGSGSRDRPEAVHENRRRGAHYLGVPSARLATPWQVHSAEAIVVEEPFSGDRPQVDAVVTRKEGLAVGVLTADCGPVLFADTKAGVVAAAHAGWRGAVGGVLEATVEAMERCGSKREDIVAVLGPTITQDNYEVGSDMAAEIAGRDKAYERFFAIGASSDKRQFDLPGFIVARLEEAGVAASFVGHCTYAEEDRFFSYRRATHRGEADYGRQLSAIVIAE